MTVRARLSTTAAALLVGLATAACGGSAGGAPSDASEDDFCQAQTSLFTDLDIDMSDPDGGLPSEKEMADAMHGWSDTIAEVGTPEGISDDARAGFEEMVKATKDISEEDLKSPDLDALESDLSESAQKNVEAFNSYVTDTCGSMFGDIEMPEVPEAG